MNCERANQIDLVNYLHELGYDPSKIRREDHWYLSPLRNEKESSFKVNKTKNTWYDHGLGKGGNLVDFATEYYRCDVSDALQKIVSFQEQKNLLKNIAERPPVHPQNILLRDKDAEETAIKILAAKQPLNDPTLCRYLEQRKIGKTIADRYCYEVLFKLTNKEKAYRAIGFKNIAGGYELRNEYFKGSSSPKYVSYMDSKAANVKVFEGFFDFLSYQSIHQNKGQNLTNFLVLNSLSFFERSLLLMEKHENIHLYLDHDNAGRKWTNIAEKRSLKFKDESKFYKGHKDLNDWLMNFGKLEKKKSLTHSLKRLL
jgi:DNA primase